MNMRMKYSISKEKILYIVVLLVIGVYAFTYEAINYSALSITSLVFIFFNSRESKNMVFDFGILFLFQGLIIAIYYNYYFISGINSVDVYKVLSPVVMYILGQSIAYGIKNEQYIIIATILFFASSACYGMLSILFCIQTGKEGTYFGNIIGIYDSLNMLNIEVLFIGFTGTFVWAVCSMKRHMWISIIIILLNMIAQVALLVYHLRFNAYVVSVELLFITAYLIYRLLNKKTNSTVACFGSIIAAVAIIFVFMLLFKYDFLGMKDYYYNSFWGNDGGILHNYRYLNTKEAIKGLITGSRKGVFITSNGINTSYNMLLDYVRDYGVYVFPFLFIFQIMTFYNLFVMLKNQQVSKELKLLLPMIYIAFNVIYTFDGIAKNQIIYWDWGLVVAGMIRAYSKNRG